jgi:cytochrome c oxidase subunit 2
VLERYVASASSYSGDIDWLILLILVVVGFWFVVAQVVLFGIVFKFSAKRHKKALYITGEKASEKRWVAWPHYATLVCDVVLIIGATRVWYNVKQTMPPADETVRVDAQQWAWTFTHAGLDGKLGTPDDIRKVDELHLVSGKTYHFELTSRDVLHSFSVPAFRLKQDAVPGRVIRGWFKPTMVGRFDIQCAEICGVGHGIMPAALVVETAEQHAAWLRANTDARTAAGAPAVGTAPEGAIASAEKAR